MNGDPVELCRFKSDPMLQKVFYSDGKPAAWIRKLRNGKCQVNTNTGYIFFASDKEADAFCVGFVTGLKEPR